MPELPDVEVFRRYLDSTALRQKVARVEFENKKVLQVPARKIQGALKGKSLREI